MVISEIRTDIETVEKNISLWKEINFASRIAALDFLEFHVIDRLDGLCQQANPPAELLALQQAAEQLKNQLEAIDIALFRRLREAIRQGRCSGAALLHLIDTYVGRCSGGRQAQQQIGYDNLDLFTNSLFDGQTLPQETIEREPQMVHYQKTPARVILDLIERAQFTEKDVFYDLGSGLGQVSLLVHLLSGVTANGVEVEPAYCAYANACAADLNVPNVSFIQADARTANYATGTVFFLYTPFEGQLLQDVLNRLRAESQRRHIRIFTYGPCTRPVSRQSWLTAIGQTGVGNELYKLAHFVSAPVVVGS
ncbi:hypothetical protein [uncultured Fibrella sp.]|uniref:hypothetical protein n=1 Tax=uncultured Fibrella sp. TaxID=1284596 RepID=UPI0035CBF04E